MRILVTGGAGYIGGHTVRQLVKTGHEVLIYDNLCTGNRSSIASLPMVEADIADATALSTALDGIDAVMHFAAHAYVGESVEQPRKYFSNNVHGGLTLLHTMLDRGVRRLIFSSTCAVYGNPTALPITEDSPRNPVNPYGISKRLFEDAMAAYDRAYGLKYVSLRYFNAAGASEDGDLGELHNPETHLIPLALQAASNTTPHLRIFGTDYDTPDGTCIRDYIHVMDLADAHVRALGFLDSSEQSVSLNLGTGKGHSVNEVARMVEQVTGRTLPIKYCARRAGDPAILVADPSRARGALAWQATRNLYDMVESAWQWLLRTTRH